jgi:hypothetical protein
MRLRFAQLRALILPATLAGTYLALHACGNGMPSGPPGGPVSGAADMHCTAPDGRLEVQSTSQASCQARPDAGPPGTPDANQNDVFPPTLFGTAGNDDDCKYHYEWSSTPVYENYDIHFHLTLTNLGDNSPATGADPYMEITLNDQFSAPPTNPKTTETAAGVYDIGPIQFDMPGKWLIRFHVFHSCLDLVDTSPHGHAAFFLNVP